MWVYRMSVNPSVNPANLGSMVGMLREVLSKFLQNVDDMLPARVISYDAATKLVEVQPLIMLALTDGSTVSRAAVASIPVLQIGGGLAVLDFKISPGDIGFIKASDRDISLFLQSFDESAPNTFRKHNFSDAIFIPAPLHGYTVDSAASVTLRTVDGSQTIELFPGHIEITSNTSILLDAPLTTITGDLVANASRGTGTATFTGTIHASVDVLGGASPISLVHHIHGGVQTGSGDTGQPI